MKDNIVWLVAILILVALGVGLFRMPAPEPANSPIASPVASMSGGAPPPTPADATVVPPPTPVSATPPRAPGVKLFQEFTSHGVFYNVLGATWVAKPEGLRLDVFLRGHGDMTGWMQGIELLNRDGKIVTGATTLKMGGSNEKVETTTSILYPVNARDFPLRLRLANGYQGILESPTATKFNQVVAIPQ